MKLEKYKQRNPKKIGIAIFTIACVLLIAFVFIYSSFASFETNETRSFINGNVVDPGDLYFAFYVDGVISSTMPGKGEGYVLDNEKITCTNGATVEWLDDEWAPKINNLDKKVSIKDYQNDNIFAKVNYYVQYLKEIATYKINKKTINELITKYESLDFSNLNFYLVHGDLSSQNMLWKNHTLYLIDFDEAIVAT